MTTIATPVLIIGAGAAGLRTAIELREHGVDCLVVGKRAHGDAHTSWAAGGINAVLGNIDPEDRWDIHAADTIREGGYICDPRAVELLTRAAPDRVLELDAWGCGFDRLEDGRINQRYFGAQSYRRTCFVGDETGRAILGALVRRAAELGTEWRENVFVTRLLVRDGAVHGAAGIDLDDGGMLCFRAPFVVLAAGGCTSIYARSSSRADENTGDAMALACHAGVALRDMEMIQFHPTGMIKPPALSGRLVTEAMRGEGARLFNARGERFMTQYAPEQMELAARDVVARANYEEIRSGRGTADGGVLLDISHEDPDRIRARLPRMYQAFLDQGIDITQTPVEVAPTAHYPMGGVLVDTDSGETSVAGLYAVGEAASGVHGANRLGGNSLAETVVFGQRVGAHIRSRRDRGRSPRAALDRQAVERHAARLAALGRARGEHDVHVLIERVRRTMWQHAGIIRSGDGLRQGLRRIDEIATAAQSLDARTTGAATRHICHALDLEFMLVCAEAILRSALLREESRGAHYRTDAPDTSDAWRCTVLCARADDGALRLWTEPVPAVPAAIQRALDEHHALDYHHLE